MGKKRPLILIVGGLLIGGITWFGYNFVNTKSDAEVLQDAMLDMQAEAEQKQQDRAALRAQVLSAPDACDGVKTKIFYDVVELEPDAGQDWPDWSAIASPQELSCIREAFHQTNAHAYKIQGKNYERSAPSLNRLSDFVLDVSGASLFTDGIDYGDTDKSASILVNGFYADRATSTYGPERDY